MRGQAPGITVVPATDHAGTTATCSSRAELKAALADLD